MPIPLQAANKVVAAKIQTNIGEAVSLSNSDADLRFTDRTLNVVSQTIRRPKQGSIGSESGVAGGKSTTFSGTTYLHGKGGTGSPAIGKWLRACGFDLDGAYFLTTDTSTWKDLTIGHYRDGRYYEARGVMLNVKFIFVAGQPVQVDFSGLGGWSDNPSSVGILSPSLETARPPIFAGTGSFSLDSSSDFKISRLELDVGALVELREDPNSPGGYAGGWISDILPVVTMDPEAMALATKNWYAAQTNNEEVTLALTVGSTANNTIEFSLGSLQLGEAPTDAERNGKLVDSLSFHVNNNDLAIYFS